MSVEILVIDFETFFSPDFTLKKLTTEAYIRDSRFEALCLCIENYQTGAQERLEGPLEIETWVRAVDWSTTVVIAQHAAFDVGILSMVYGVSPRSIICTMSMARAVFGPGKSASLAALAARFGLAPKTVPYGRFIGRRWADMDDALREELVDGCMHDVELTKEIAKRLLAAFPRAELPVVDLTVRMFTEPAFIGDEAKLRALAGGEQQRKADLLQELGVSTKELQSADSFVALLEAEGEEVPTKQGKLKPIPCVASTDPYMQELSQRQDRAGLLAQARLDVRSTIDETRAGRMADCAARGPMPVYLTYFGAATSRWSGGDKVNMQNLPRLGGLRGALQAPPGHKIVVADFCVAAGQLVATRDRGLVPIEQIAVDDFVWDGVEWVSHEGAVCRGEKEVWTYQGLTSTPDHVVWTDSDPSGVTMEEAAKAGRNLRKASPPSPLLQTSVRGPGMSGVQELRGEGDKISLRVGSVHGGLCLSEASAPDIRRGGDRPHRQRQALRTGEFTFIDEAGECEQPDLHRLGGYGIGGETGAGRLSSQVPRVSVWCGPIKSSSWAWTNRGSHIEPGETDPPRAQEPDAGGAQQANEIIQGRATVYDIINAGPRRRFTVSGVLVSNCQVEYRVLCGFAGQLDKLQALRDKRDIYCEFGALLYGRPITKADKAERQLAKKVVLGAGYGIGRTKLWRSCQNDGLDIDEEFARKAVEAYRSDHRAVVNFWAKCDAALKHLAAKEDYDFELNNITVPFRNGSIILPNGIACPFELEWDPFEQAWMRTSRYGKARYWGGGLTEFLCQSFARVALSDVMLKVWKNLGVRPCLLVHDELVYIVVDEYAESVLQWLIAWMSETPSWWRGGPPFSAEGAVMERYGK